MAKEKDAGSDVRVGVSHGPGCGDCKQEGTHRPVEVNRTLHFKQFQFRIEKLNVRIHTFDGTRNYSSPADASLCGLVFRYMK